jgi:hypothetical protein
MCVILLKLINSKVIIHCYMSFCFSEIEVAATTLNQYTEEYKIKILV